MNVKTKYGPGQIVFLKTDNEQNEFMIYSITVTEKEVVYNIRNLDSCISAYEFEISAEKDLLKTL